LTARRTPAPASASAGAKPHALPHPAHPTASAPAKAEEMPVPPPRMRRQTQTEERGGALEKPRVRAGTSDRAARPPAIEMGQEPPPRAGGRPMLSPTNPFLDAPLASASANSDTVGATWEKGPMDSEA
jgi:hypothetical protein